MGTSVIVSTIKIKLQNSVHKAPNILQRKNLLMVYSSHGQKVNAMSSASPHMLVLGKYSFFSFSFFLFLYHGCPHRPRTPAHPNGRVNMWELRSRLVSLRHEMQRRSPLGSGKYLHAFFKNTDIKNLINLILLYG